MKEPLSLMLSLLVCIQIFNSKASLIIGPLSIGKIGTASILMCFVMVLFQRRSLHLDQIGSYFLAIVWIYICAATLGVIVGYGTPQSVKFLITALVQFSLACTVLLIWKPTYFEHLAICLGAFAVALATLNLMNTMFHNEGLLLVRTNQGRVFLSEIFGERVVSVTNIYGQFGVMLVLGGVIWLDLWSGVRSHVCDIPKKVLRYSGFVIISLGVATLQSRAVIIGYSVSFLLYFWMTTSKIIRRIMMVSCAITMLIFKEQVASIFFRIYEKFVGIQISTVDTRINSYVEALSIIADNPFGIGAGGYQTQTESIAVLHNTYLDAFVTTGWIGGMAFLFIVALPWIVLWQPAFARERLAAGFLSGYTGALTVMFFYTGLTEYLVFILVASVVGHVRCPLSKKECHDGGVHINA